MNSRNMEQLIGQKYQFILGARIKSESDAVKERILSLGLENGEVKAIKKDGGLSLLVSYAEGRAKKDRANREKGIEKLRKNIRSGKLTKANINNRGYNKLLKMEGEVRICIDEQKLAEAQKWDGLKGYITNMEQGHQEVINEYNHLWQIEKAFRISKTELRIRPIYHQLSDRIEAHICISFAAYKLYKELERKLALAGGHITVHRALEIIPKVIAIQLTHPATKEKRLRAMFKSEQVQQDFEHIKNALGASMS